MIRPQTAELPLERVELAEPPVAMKVAGSTMPMAVDEAAVQPTVASAPAPVPVRPAAEPVTSPRPVVEPSPAVEPNPAVAPHRAVAPPPHAAPKSMPELTPVTLALPPGSDLELVETVHRTAPAPEPEAPTAPRRVRPPRVEIAAEPLQMVETHKEPPPPAP